MIKIKVKSFRKNYESEKNYEDGSAWGYYTAVVDLREVPAELEEWRKVNLRDTNTKGDVYNAIANTIKNAPESFLRKNRGITILAESVELNKSNDEITLELGDPKLHGIVDGGHTFTAIKDERSEATTGFVAINILTGVSELREVVDIVDARNRSRSAQAQSLDNIAGVYDPIKSALKNQSYADKISYSEYEIDDEMKKKPISVRDILAYIYALNPEDHKGMNHPIAAYSGKGAVVNYFSPPPAAEPNAVAGKGYADKVIEKAAPLLPSILNFVDLLYKEIPYAYNGKEEGRWGALKKMAVRSREVQLHFSGDVGEYDYPDSLLFPVLAAFRQNMEIKGGKWAWKKEPEIVWEKRKAEIGGRLRQIVDREDSPNKLGKAAINWTLIADAINR